MTAWIFKSEPSTYSFLNLEKDKKTAWNGIRNYQARNHLRNVKPGDTVWFYHSGDDRAVVGLAKAASTAYPDGDAEEGWLQVDLEVDRRCKRPISLKELKAHRALRGMVLVKQARLSVSPLTDQEHQALLEMA